MPIFYAEKGKRSIKYRGVGKQEVLLAVRFCLIYLLPGYRIQNITQSYMKSSANVMNSQ